LKNFSTSPPEGVAGLAFCFLSKSLR